MRTVAQQNSRIVNRPGRPSRAVDRFEHRLLDLQPEPVSHESAEAEAAPPSSEEVLAQAQAEAEALRAAAREEVEAWRQQAYEEGVRQGAEAGREAYLESVARSADALHAAADELVRVRERFLEELEPQVLGLVRDIAERVVHRELRQDPGLLQQTVRRALEAVADEPSVVVRLHPVDAQAIREQRVTLLEEFSGFSRLEVVADESVPEGGCLAETPQFTADARVDTLLRNVLAALEP